MIFQHTIDKVLDGTKTQTRRVVKEGEVGTLAAPFNKTTYFNVMNPGGRVKWQVGKSYAAQPGRTQKGVGRIEIISLRREWVELISDYDVRAEGFANKFDFWETWKAMHGHTGMNCWVIEFELVQ